MVTHKLELSSEDRAKIAKADDSVLSFEEMASAWAIDVKTGEPYPVSVGRKEYNRRLQDALRGEKRRK